MKNQKPNQTTTKRLVLPLMKTIEDADQLSRLEQDNFYISAYMIQAWLGHATLAVSAEYAEKKEPRTRALQSGQTWRSFMETLGDAFKVALDGEDDQVGRVAPRAPSAQVGPDFQPDHNDAQVGPDCQAGRNDDQVGPDRRAGRPQSSQGEDSNIPTNDKERPAQRSGPTSEAMDTAQLTHFIGAMFRFVTFEDPLADALCEALSRYRLETVDPQQILTDPVAQLMRICDWLDSVLHQQTHMLWYLSPASFDPDPAKRELTSLGVIQRYFAAATEAVKAHWHWHFGEAAERHADSPKMTALATGLSSDATKVWNYPEVDTAVIALWPLVKRHNWTYADLLKTIRPTLKRADAYPCDREQSFATYCTNVLGLRKTGKGRSSEGELAGAEVARRVLGLTK